MNQNQIDRLYKVAISRNAYANKIAKEMTSADYAALDAGPKIPAAGSPDADAAAYAALDAAPGIPAAGSPDAEAAAFTAEGERQGEYYNKLREQEARNIEAPTGFDINKFIDSIENRVSGMANKGADRISDIAHNPKVQIGAGLGAAGLAGYGIYKHLNKKKKRHEDED